MKGIIKHARFILKSQTPAWINLFRRLYFIVMFDTLFDFKVTSDSTLLPFFRVIASLFGKSTRFITGAHLNEEEKLYFPWKIQRNESDVNWAINLFRRKGSVKSSYVLVIYLASIKKLLLLYSIYSIIIIINKQQQHGQVWILLSALVYNKHTLNRLYNHICEHDTAMISYLKHLLWTSGNWNVFLLTIVPNCCSFSMDHQKTAYAFRIFWNKREEKLHDFQSDSKLVNNFYRKPHDNKRWTMNPSIASMMPSIAFSSTKPLFNEIIWYVLISSCGQLVLSLFIWKC